MELITFSSIFFITIYLLFSEWFICSMWSSEGRTKSNAIITCICIFLIAPIATPILLGILIGRYFDDKYLKD